MGKSCAALIFILLDLTFLASSQERCDGSTCYQGEKVSDSSEFYLVPGKPSHSRMDTSVHLSPVLLSVSCGKVTCPGESTCCPNDNCCEQKNGKCCNDPKYCCEAGHTCCGEDSSWCCPESKKCSSSYGKCEVRKDGGGSSVITVAFFLKLLPFFLLTVFIR